MVDTDDTSRCGYVTIIGRPNVGKSTLLNRLVGQKISITSRKPQTTQRRLLGIKTDGQAQLIFIDTPGMQSKHKDAISLYMKKEINNALSGIDVVIFVVEALKWTDGDEEVLAAIENISVPVILVINKVDRINNRERLLPFISSLSERREFAELIPLSATRAINIDTLEKLVRGMLPSGPMQFSQDQVTDRSTRFIAAEFIREKLVRKLGKELPYRLTVIIDNFKQDEDGILIDAVIWVESDSQKSIVIGRNGALLKSVGEQSRKDMEEMLESRVFLRTWVKVRKNWSDDQSMLQQFGFDH